MKITIQPVRHCRNRWIATSFDRATHYELWSAGANPRRLRTRHGLRITGLAEAQRLAAVLEPSRAASRTRDSILGCRYSDIADEVAARNPGVVAQSLREHEYALAQQKEQ